MAEPTREDTGQENASPEEAKPKLKAVDRQPGSASAPKAPAPAPETRPAQRERRGSRMVLWLLAALLVIALVWAGLQSQQLQVAEERNLALVEQVQGLEVQLSAASLRLQTYEMQQELVRGVAADLAEQVGRLQELVSPAPPPAVETGAP